MTNQLVGSIIRIKHKLVNIFYEYVPVINSASILILKCNSQIKKVNLHTTVYVQADPELTQISDLFKRDFLINYSANLPRYQNQIL